MTTTSLKSEQPRVRLRALGDDLFEILCTGQLQPEDVAYVEDLRKQMAKTTNKISLMFETLTMTGYSTKFPMGHIPFFKDYSARIHKIAVVHKMASVGFAIATVSLASNTNIKGFAVRADALVWLKEP